jgi:alkanesulfonate monooxygenase SsuD/methylene tetrahydromethanopterin reductase-like flavin-dependent oxidoreductase (luciferase family)
VTQVGSRTRRPSLGLILPPTTQGELVTADGDTRSTTNRADEVAEVCRRGEAAGADSLWAVDHLYWPHPISEPFTTLAVAATATTAPVLGTCVLQLPLRRPSAVAKQATTLQLLSGGRFVLGVGVGIHEGEYQRAGVDYHRRGRLMDEGVAEVREAWAPSDVSDYVMEPSCAPVPIWFGGSSAAARRRAATSGDGWIPLFLTPDDYAAALSELRRDAEDVGRDPDAVTPGVVVFARVGDDDATTQGSQWLSDMYRLPPKAFTRHIAAGSPDVCAERLHQYVEAGAQHIAVMVAGSPAVEHFSELRAAFAPEERILTGSPA